MRRFTQAFAALSLLVAGFGLALAGDDLAKKLQDALKAKDDAAVQAACDDLVKADTKEALVALLGQISKAEGTAYWSIVAAAGSFKAQAPLEELGHQIVTLQATSKSPSADLLFALQNNGSKDVVKPLAYILEKGKYELQLMAANGLALIREPASVEAILAAWKREEKADAELARRLKGAFASLTGQAQDDPKGAEAWWKDHKGEPLAQDKPVERPRDREFKTVEKGAAARILVLSGDRTNAPEEDDQYDNDYDKIQEILVRRKIPHTVVFKYQFDKEPEKYLKEASAILVNCNCIQPYCVCKKCDDGAVERKEKENRLGLECSPKCDVHKFPNHRLATKSLLAIKKWVENEGGYLYTEDWGLLDILMTIWPEKVGSGTRTGTIDAIEDAPNLIRKRDAQEKAIEHFPVNVTPVRGTTSHPLMRGVWHQVGSGTTSATTARQWQIDDESPAIEVKDKKDVIVLFESAELTDLTKGNTAVAVTFRPGAKGKVGTEPTKGTGEWTLAKSGRVLHTLSHFGKQSGSQDGEALENLLVNFLLEAGRRKDTR